MTSQKIVVALGHSALGKTFPEQQEAVKIAAAAVSDLIEEKYRVTITHSNGPQIGMIHTAMTEFSRLEPENTVAPMSLCSAMSQGYIGFDLQNAIRTELLNRGIYRPVTSLVTQVRVDPFDPAFTNPTKIIGRYMNEEEAHIEEKKGNHVVHEEKGWRRVIASPHPLEIYEMDSIRLLTDAGQIVIAAGGGGIPVLQQETHLKGASAVIEKDLTASLLARELDADILLLLTSVEKVSLDFQTANEVKLDTLSVADAKKYMSQGQFTSGSMQPKVEAAVSFVESKPGRKAVITSLTTAIPALHGKTGTCITA